MKLLQALMRILFPERRHEALVRTLHDDDVLKLLKPVPLALPEGVALLPFRTPVVRALITEAKYHGNARAQRLLGRALTEYLRDWLPDALAYESRTIALVPVPLSKKRYRERGYNQAELIARYAGDALSLTILPHVLKRTRNTAPQTTLGKAARKENVAGAFAAQLPNPAYLYIVVDDVATTGATLAAVAEALTNAGAERVIPLAISY
ncbi:MAG TPA: ComF family protein [Candidatus Paceibacterota bacterium]|nr:ComF family protein [Candidatus Paceibacterota bacterium]